MRLSAFVLPGLAIVTGLMVTQATGRVYQNVESKQQKISNCHCVDVCPIKSFSRAGYLPAFLPDEYKNHSLYLRD